MAKTNATSARHLLMLQHQADAVRLRKQGNSYAMIAAKLGLSAPAVFKLVKAALAAQAVDTATEAETLRQVEDARLDDALRGIYPAAIAGHLGAIGRFLQISESRRKLWGLDAPTRAEVTGKDGGPLTFQQLIEAATNDRDH